MPLGFSLRVLKLTPEVHSHYLYKGSDFSGFYPFALGRLRILSFENRYLLMLPTANSACPVAVSNNLYSKRNGNNDMLFKIVGS